MAYRQDGTNLSNPVTPAQGGTGIANNASSTLAISGAFATTLTVTNTTGVTLPTSGTLATTSQIPSTPISLANGGTNASLAASNGGIVYSGASAFAVLGGTATAGQILRSGASTTPAWSTATYPATAGTSGKVLISDGTNIVSSTPTFPNASATSGKFIQSDGTNWIASTPTIPATAGTSGKILVSDGTNFISSTPTFPNASAASGKFIRSDGTNWIASTPTLPTSAGTSGKILQSNGTNYVESTPTYPSTSGSTGKILISDGTNNIYSTPTYPNSATGTGKILRADGTNWAATTATYPDTAGSSGNVLTSDGTNWSSSAAPAGNLLVTQLTLTSSQIKNLVGTPITLVAAPGAGKVIFPIAARAKFVYGGSNVFVAGASQVINLAYSGGQLIAPNLVQNATIVSSTTGYCGVGLQVFQNSSFDNQAVNIVNSTATNISGNAANDNTIIFSLAYYIATM